MGSRKTYAMMELVKNLHPQRVVVLSSRQTFTLNIMNNFNRSLVDSSIEFKSYKNLKSITDKNYLIIQMESLYRLEDCPPFDLVLIDESEACLKQFNSPTMVKKPGILWRNLCVLKHLLEHSSQRVFLDAFISNKTIDLVEARVSDISKAIVLVNKTITVRRQALH